MNLSYFGTDGIRGRVGGDLLNEGFVRRVGYALARFLKKHNTAKPITVLIGRDTRGSGPMLESAICEGLCAEGIHVIHLGVLPSPAISMTVRDMHADLGISITASHNPATDNGLKLFDNRGWKFTTEAEAAIEHFIREEPEHEPIAQEPPGYDHDACGYYVNYLRSLMHQRCLKGWTIVLDTANGAGFQTSTDVFKHYGATLIPLGNKPDGSNINEGLGSEHPELMCEAVRQHGARLGIAHDGDADRAVFCDEHGVVLSGEEVLGMIGLDMLERGTLARKTLVTTIHSNLGLDKALEAAGGRVERVQVGDRNVLLHLRNQHLTFGGESSGHYLFFEHSRAGDGLLAAIRVTELMLRTGLPLSQLRRAVTLFPQKTLNLRVGEKRPLEECRAVQTALRKAEKALSGRGRVLLRYSGTEPKIRLLVESSDKDLLASHTDSLARALARDLEIRD